MTGDIWTNWLKKLDNKMRTKKRQIVMMCDNCAAHGDVRTVRLTNVKLVFMPLNATSAIQPMNQGIITNFKKHYRALVLRHLMGVMEHVTDETKRATELARKLTAGFPPHAGRSLESCKRRAPLRTAI